MPNNRNIFIKATFAIIYHKNPFSQYRDIFELLDMIKDDVEKSDIKSFKIFWMGNFLETIFVKLIKDYNSERMLQLVASQGHHGLMGPFLGLRIQETIHRLYQTEKDFIKCIREAYENQEFFIYLEFLKKLAKMQWCWCYNNSLKGEKNAIYAQIKSIETTLLFLEQLAEVISEDLKFQIILDSAYLHQSMKQNKLRDEYIEKAIELATKLDHKGSISEVNVAKDFFLNSKLTIQELLNYKDKEVHEEITDQQEEKMIKHLLKIGGIDITADDELARLARIGLKDRNPDRIFRYCEHLFGEVINYGPIWDAVGLPSTGTKIIFCECNEKSVIRS